MPIFDYECLKCTNIDERICSFADAPKKGVCTKCGHISVKIIADGHGGFHTDTPKWLDQSVNDALQGDDPRPITTRGQYEDHLKRNKVEPIERKINPYGTF